MTEATGDEGRAPYYDGREFPLEALSPSEFEAFVFACLLCVQDVLGLRITGKPTGSGDGGFDVQGIVDESKRLACVQCKRQKEPLGTPQFAEELAKVAATTAMEGSDVGEHRFICTGGVRSKLRKCLRENPRRQLAAEACDRFANAPDGELASLRVQLEERGVEPRQVVESYVLGLDLLTVWDRQEFDSCLSSRWSEVLQVAERYFRIASLVREHPRASFDRPGYISEHVGFTVVVEPRIAASNVPEFITTSSAADPSVAPTSSNRAIKKLSELEGLHAGELVILLGDGGVGKSTALKLLRANILRAASQSTLPVLISLANYVPGGLERAIHQELGIEYGTWHSLPDRVLLLCDGLNECSSANVAAFMEELKPLLKRARISCILSTRESTRHRHIVLAQPPLACVKIQGVTPIGIRRIAEHEIQDGTTSDFMATYRSLADGCGSPLLWTPFAVMVAVALWKRDAKLPVTLGGMLEELLRARCTRNSESSEEGLGTDVILLLSGALAFQCLVVDGRLGCPARDAGRCLREAKRRCADALGIADIREVEIVELLARHEVLCLSRAGDITFGHQMLAGALAAPVLSRIWRNQTNCLDEPLADDAWVFAARMVPREEVADLIRAVFAADLMLGARVARELPMEFRALADRLLEPTVAPDCPESVRVQGLFALARHGSPRAVAKLRELATDEDSPVLHAAQCALAATGALDYLRELLPEVDLMRSGPFTSSGGKISIWEAGPLPVRLDLARDRLSKCNLGAPVGESLNMLAYEQDPEDAKLAEMHLRAARDLSAWDSAFYALHETSPERAQVVLGEMLSETPDPGDRASLLRSAALIGLDIDLRSAFECAISELSSDARDVYSQDLLISDVVAKATLPFDVVTVVERELPSSVGDRRARLWKIAQGCKSASLAAFAVSCVRDWSDDLGFACNFFLGQLDLADAHKQQLVEFCESGFGNEGSWYSWDIGRALALVGRLGFSAKTRDCLSRMVQRLVRVQRAVEEGAIASLSPADAEILDEVNLEHMRYHLGHLVSQLIPAVALVRTNMSEDILLSLLGFDTGSKNVVEQLREALSDLSDAAIDTALNQIAEPWTRLSGLVAVCGRGSTNTRLSLLAGEIRRFYNHPAALHHVQRAIEDCWCKEVCEMVVKTVAAIPSWSDYDSQHFWDFAQAIAKIIGPDNLGAIDAAISHVRTAFAQRILILWRDRALGGRVGLLRLSKRHVLASGDDS